MLALGLAVLAPSIQDRTVTDYRLDRETGEELEVFRIERDGWRKGDLAFQGFLGASLYETVERTGGGSPDVDGSGEEASELPVIGGGGLWKLGGGSVDFGLEGMFSFSGRVDALAFAGGGMGGAIAVEVDMFLVDVYGGPFVNLFLDEDSRVYVAAGPLMQWADFTQESETLGIDDSGEGFGTGFYARTGIEFRLGEDSMIGFGCRWADSSVDLDGGLGTLDLDGFQFVLTVTRGF
jgi:hypothetical protein